MENNYLLQLYHERWGHQNKRHIKDMIQKELGIRIHLDNKPCEPCIYGKAHRFPFGTRKKATSLGELVSADNVLKKLLAHAKNLGHSVKEFLSDNGGEFDKKEVCAILSQEGITQRLTAPYTPAQNGGSECEMLTIIEMAKTFKYSNPDINYPAAMGLNWLPQLIWLKEENRVILSRDVIFQEKPIRCIQLMLKEPSNEGKHAEEKLDEKDQEPTSSAVDDPEENQQVTLKQTMMKNFNPQVTDN
ncbi:hypothetical protein AVEN_198443-1 [Araneus ventricosus]|uniref:Integrase catalytic domain-containing protein n=1 Tax=Araneus ventricosus TaxID=182803 RepID=A0A4Y2V541_ARAVE|nr:hypothetical protein AVEN_198443-1 [Araneus ventricosus]